MEYYSGNGCSKHNDCFTCPFTDCQLDKREKHNIDSRHSSIRELFGKGYNPKEIYNQTGVSLRTIYRVVKA